MYWHKKSTLVLVSNCPTKEIISNHTNLSNESNGLIFSLPLGRVFGQSVCNASGWTWNWSIFICFIVKRTHLHNNFISQLTQQTTAYCPKDEKVFLQGVPKKMSNKLVLGHCQQNKEEMKEYWLDYWLQRNILLIYNSHF